MSDQPLLAFCGVATADAIAVVGRYPSADERIIAEDVVFGGGGPAATAAVAAARLGMRAAFIGAVGTDQSGDRIVAELTAEGVDTSAIMRVGTESARSVVIIDGPRKTRAIANRPGPAIELEGNPDAQRILAAADWVHVDQHGWATVRRYLDRVPGPRPRLSVDAGNPIPGFTAADTALYAPTLPALQARYAKAGEKGGIPELLRRALADGAGLVAVTNGGDGAYLMSDDGRLFGSKTPDLQIVSTLGAGDVFHGALVAALVMAENGTLAGLQEALDYATAVASLSCRGIDGRSRIPDHQEMSSFFRRTAATPA